MGREVARRLGWAFLDADDFHSPEAVRKMASGTPLDDADRAPWLARLHEEIAARVARGERAVLACSALKARYRDVLAGELGAAVLFVFLDVGKEELERRLRERRGHFFAPALLASQLETLEPPVDSVVVAGGGPVDAVARAVVAAAVAGHGET